MPIFPKANFLYKILQQSDEPISLKSCSNRSQNDDLKRESNAQGWACLKRQGLRALQPQFPGGRAMVEWDWRGP